MTSGRQRLRLGKILIVDDEEQVRRAVALVLERLGYEIETAGDGQQALDRLDETDFDLVITDLKMLGLDGKDLLESIRAAGAGCDVLMISGGGSIPEAVESMRLGASNFLVKPFQIETLKAEVRRIFRERQEGATLSPSRLTPNLNTPDLSTSDLALARFAPTRGGDDSVSSYVGRYEVRSRLGAGGMGEVFEAFDPALMRPVAIKMVTVASTQARRSTLLERFRREGWVVGNLNHPNIVAVYDFGEDAARGCLYLVMELLEGGSVRRLLTASSRLEVARAAAIARDVACGLEVAHRSDVIHRDVKPENVLLAKNGTAKLADFGIARIPVSDLTTEGSWLGSPFYFAPEMLSGSSGIDHRVDQFALGTLIHEMLTGRTPFEANDHAIVARNIVESTPPSLRELGIEAPAALQEVLDRLHAKDPADRYADGGELTSALNRIVQQLQP